MDMPENSNNDSDHSCEANLSTAENEIVVAGSEVSVYRNCTVCGTELETIYEFVETVPA